ncbi:hypothetical protein [Sorangium sp. So ce341]|uniref:hypothetical protein n=1 Tax=Sorangium sp. So ce341 TaxID=3133302 RepID=UPI003F609017
MILAAACEPGGGGGASSSAGEGGSGGAGGATGTAGTGGEGGATGTGGAGGEGGATGTGGAGGEGGATAAGGAGGEGGATGAGGEGGGPTGHAGLGAPAWAHVYPNDGDAQGLGIASDASGNFYVTGEFEGTVDFGAGPMTSAGGSDIFLLKLDPSGATLWSKRFGSPHGETAFDVTIDGSGDLLLVGSYGGDAAVPSVDFGGGSLPAPGTFSSAGFVVKLDPDGSHLWSRGALVSEFTELRRQSAEKIAVDALGNAYVTLHSAGDTEGVVSVARLDAEGDLVWTREIPTAGNLNRHGDLALDSAGNVLAVSESKYSPTGYCPCVLQFAVTKFAPTGDVIWSWLIGPESPRDTYPETGVGAVAVAVNAADEVFVSGWSFDEVDFGDGALRGGPLLVKVDADGELVFSWLANFNSAIAVDAAGAIFLSGNASTSINGLAGHHADRTESWTIFFWGQSHTRDMCVSPLGTIALTGTAYDEEVGFGSDAIPVGHPTEAFVAAFTH